MSDDKVPTDTPPFRVKSTLTSAPLSPPGSTAIAPTTPSPSPQEEKKRGWRKDHGLSLREEINRLPVLTKAMTEDKGLIRLRNMLRYKRPSWSKSEKEFLARFLKPLGCGVDSYGNYFRNVVKKDCAPSRILWSSHTDTVHRSPGIQSIGLFNDGFFRSLDKNADCLGGDCTAGVWLMTEMIMAGVPGRYVFHRSEERGGLGSAFVAQSGKLLDGIDIAIAFDRRGFSSVITHQVGGRCCSEEFAIALAAKFGIFWHPDSGGVFTDTANYKKIIPECTNISVGYLMEHSENEALHAPFLLELRDKMLSLSLDDLPVKRDPSIYETKYGAWEGSWRRGRSSVHSTDLKSQELTVSDGDWVRCPDGVERCARYSQDPYMLLYRAVCEYPDTITTFLESFGWTAADVKTLALEYGKINPEKEELNE